MLNQVSIIDTIIHYKAIIVITSFLIIFLFEYVYSKEKTHAKIKRLLKNLTFWPINIALSLLINLPITYYASTVNLWIRPSYLQNTLGLILDILLLDLILFWWHRTIHQSQLLWRFHAVHHLDEYLDSSSAIRFHFGEIALASFARGIVVIAFAIPFTSILIFETLVLIFTLFHHSNMKLPAKFEKYLSYFIVTPSIHWVHHHALRADTDSNYGTIFSFWDRLYHTKSQTSRFSGMKIGVEGQKDIAFKKLFFLPFKK